MAKTDKEPGEMTDEELESFLEEQLVDNADTDPADLLPSEPKRVPRGELERLYRFVDAESLFSITIEGVDLKGITVEADGPSLDHTADRVDVYGTVDGLDLHEALQQVVFDHEEYKKASRHAQRARDAFNEMLDRTAKEHGMTIEEVRQQVYSFPFGE